MSSSLATAAVPSAPTNSTTVHPGMSTASSSASSSASSLHGSNDNVPAAAAPRPRLGTRKSSGTIIIPRDSPRVELVLGEEEFDEDDARTMSPRRNSEDLEKMSQDARAQLSAYVSRDIPGRWIW